MVFQPLSLVPFKHVKYYRARVAFVKGIERGAPQVFFFSLHLSLVSKFPLSIAKVLVTLVAGGFSPNYQKGSHCVEILEAKIFHRELALASALRYKLLCKR